MSVGIAVVLVGGCATLQVLSPGPRPQVAAATSSQAAPTLTVAPVLEPSPTPAPPEVVAQGWPAGWTDDWDMCGLPLGSSPAAATIRFAVTTAGLPAVVTVGETWTGDVSARPPAGTPTGLEVVGSIALLDGTVVGVPRTPPASSLLTAASSVPVDLTVHGDLASCVGAPAGSGGADTAPPLAAGRYEIVVLLTSTDGGQRATAVASAGDLAVSGNGGAVQPTVPTVARPPASFTTPMDQTACATSPSTDSFAHPLGHPRSLLGGTAQLVDGSLVATVTALSTGRSLAATTDGPVGVQVWRDGKIIGQGQASDLPAAQVGAWVSGASVGVPVEIVPFTCTFMNGEPWPPGTSELCATVASGWGPSIRASAAGGPWTFVLP